MGFGANGGFDFTKELKAILKKAVWSQCWIWLYKGKERIDSKEL